MEKGLISIIVAVYNAETYIVRCVDSILNQTYKNIELLLVDDGSTDRSGQICDDYEKKDDRVRVIHKSNGGLAEARNVGIQNATGEYIGFVDNDDYIKDYMYERLVYVINNEDADMVVCNYSYVDDNGDLLDVYSPILSDEVISSYEYLSRLVGPESGYYITAWNRLYRSSILKSIVFPVGRTNEDSYVVHNIVDVCRRVVIESDKLYFYTQRSDSLSRNPNTRQYFDEVNSVLNRIEFYEKKGYDMLISESMDYAIDLYLRIRRRYIFRDRKTIENILIAVETRKRIMRLVKANKILITKKKFNSLRFVNCYMIKKILSERLYVKK